MAETVYCPHGRPAGSLCPHCAGINETSGTNETNEVTVIDDVEITGYSYTKRGIELDGHVKSVRSFPVTDPDLDAPDGAVVDGYERHNRTWEKVEKNCRNHGSDDCNCRPSNCCSRYTHGCGPVNHKFFDPDMNGA